MLVSLSVHWCRELLRLTQWACAFAALATFASVQRCVCQAQLHTGLKAKIKHEVAGAPTAHHQTRKNTIYSHFYPYRPGGASICTDLARHTVYQSHLQLWRDKRTQMYVTCTAHAVMRFAGDESATSEQEEIRGSYFRSRTGAWIFECRSRLCFMLMRTIFFLMKQQRATQCTFIFSAAFGRNKETK